MEYTSTFSMAWRAHAATMLRTALTTKKFSVSSPLHLGQNHLESMGPRHSRQITTSQHWSHSTSTGNRLQATQRRQSGTDS